MPRDDNTYKGGVRIVYTEQLIEAIQAWSEQVNHDVVKVNAIVGYLAMTIGGDIFALNPYDELMNRVERLVVYERVREEFLVESLLFAFTHRIEQLIDGHGAHQARLQAQLDDDTQQPFHAHARTELARLTKEQPAMQAQQTIWAAVCQEYFDDVARVELRFKQLAMLQPENEAYYERAIEQLKSGSNIRPK